MTLRDRLPPWWHAREPRERAMLTVMVTALAAFVVWLGMFGLQGAVATAQAHYDRAAADLIEVEAAGNAIAGLLAARPPGLDDDDAFATTILDAAAASDVPVSRQRVDDAGLLTVGIDAVEPPALLGWLDGLRQHHGITPHTLDIDKRNGQLRVEIAFRPAAS